jgi:molybdopterin synthase catalytic subunit
MVSVTHTTIDVSRVLDGMATPESGAIDLFIGTVRNHSGGRRTQRLEYTAYIPMAEKLLAQIEQEIRQKWDVHNVVIVHRVGMLEIGDVAVVTAVSSAHREEAFAACRYAIDRTKSIVPIWKKEFSEDGEVWVEGQSPGHLVPHISDR